MLTKTEFDSLVEKYDSHAISEAELELLEPYRAKRAVFIAAGFGSRLVPITINTPKPLIRVHEKRIIDGLIDAVYEAGIEEVIIVRGYRKEQFDELLYKYPKIRFIDNDMYTEANNISSALLASEYLCNSYVFEADLLISNPKIIKKYHYTSDFLGIPVDRTDDWAFRVEDGVIVKQLKEGGCNCHQMVGISYWDNEAGLRLKEHLKEAFEAEGGKQLYWEQVPLKIYKSEYTVAIKECEKSDIVEIDTFEELKAIDEVYNV